MAENAVVEAETQPGTDSESAGSGQDAPLAGAAGGAKPSEAAKAGQETEGKPSADDYTPRGAEEQVPWDPQRQKRDQARANARKAEEARLDGLERMLQEQTKTQQAQTAVLAQIAEKLASGGGAARSVEQIKRDIADAKQNRPGEFADDEEHTHYADKLLALSDELAGLAEKPAQPQLAEPAKEPADAPVIEPELSTQQDFWNALDGADKAFGPEHRRQAVKELAQLFKAREWDMKPPTTQQLDDAVASTYGKLVAKAPKGKAAPTPEPPSTLDAVSDSGHGLTESGDIALERVSVDDAVAVLKKRYPGM